MPSNKHLFKIDFRGGSPSRPTEEGEGRSPVQVTVLVSPGSAALVPLASLHSRLIQDITEIKKMDSVHIRLEITWNGDS